MSSKDYYRQQINADKDLIAFGYNALAGHLPLAVMAHIRNLLAGAVNRELEHEIKVAIQGSPGFSEYLSLYLREYVDKDLHEQAKRLWRKLGWNG